jgi:hypothetical protein
MSRPTLLPPLATETLSALDRLAVIYPELAPRHEINAEADPRLLEIVKQVGKSEAHLRMMHSAAQAGELQSFGTMTSKPTKSAAQWAKRSLDAFTEVCRIATDAEDLGFPLHMEAIRKGLDNQPMPMRWRVWMAYKYVSILNRPKMTEDEFQDLIDNGFVKRQQYIPTAGEVAVQIGDSTKRAELTARDCTNHLKALGLPYAPAKRGKQKSI